MKLLIISLSAAIAILSLTQAYGYNEDHASICVPKFDNASENKFICMLTVVDDFFNSTQIDQLDTIFTHDLDTFDASYLVEPDHNE